MGSGYDRSSTADCESNRLCEFLAAATMSESPARAELLATIEFTSSPEQLRRVREVVTQAAHECECADACAHDMVIAVQEACQNVIRHAYGGRRDGKVRLEVRRLGGMLEFIVTDWAPRVDASTIKSRELNDLRPGGLGTHFMRECMDECEFLEWSEEAGNRLRMRKRIEREES